MKRTDSDYWLDLARYDLRAARAMLKAKQRLYVGFLCHLVIEKTLKAYWAHVKGSSPPFTHDLSLLAERSGILAEMDERSVTAIDFLEPLYIEGRYPTEKSRVLRLLGPAKCDWLVKETQRLHKWIRSKLSEK
ncbi:MAG: HEPN domain-containing protein [Phycisphaerae bacterium]